MRAPIRGAALVLLAASPLLAQGRVIRLQTSPGMPAEIVEQLQQRAQAAAAAQPSPQGEQSDAQPSEELQKFLQLKFDRRPSAFLKAWSEPEPSPVDENPEYEEQRTAIAALEAEIASAAEAPVPENEGEAEPTGKPEPEPVPSTEAETEAPEAEAAPTENAEAPGGAPAEATPAEPPPHPKQAELDAKKKAYEELHKQHARELLQRDVTLGRWERVAAFLAAMPGKDPAKAYEHLLKVLPQAPTPPKNQQIPPHLVERNTFSFADMLGIARAAPRDIETKVRRTQIALLGPLVQRALDTGHAGEELLRTLREEIAADEATRAFDRRDAARLLAALKRDADLGPFLPTSEQAIADNDREALNLLSRAALAEYAKEKKTEHLERAWQVTQAALATGDVAKEEKAEALRRAVDLAPKIRDELGAAWLEESFTERPDRGMEIIASIGAQSSQGFETHGQNPDFRRKALELQKTAVDALLAKAPERAGEWAPSLNHLAANWLGEAIFSYGNSDATSMGPMMQRDPFGNIFYVNYRSQQRGPVMPIEPGELLELKPGDAWASHLDASVRPRFSMVTAELFLKVGEEIQAFPYIEALAATHPEKAKDLAEEFLRVWTSNHNPNAAQQRGNPYIYMFGFDQRANAIPLTRSKQERNLAELSDWVVKLRALPIEPVDQKLIMTAFVASHSAAEIYRLETMAQVFGSLDEMDPEMLAEMAQTMRSNLVSVWREPNVQRQAGTNRKQKDIEREVLEGYSVARKVIEGALQSHPESWRLHSALAALSHDQNNYQRQVAKTSAFAGQRTRALDGLAEAAALYAKTIGTVDVDEETTEPYELWFYASLGACDLPAVDQETRLDRRQPPRIRAALDALPEEARDRHMAMFANNLFTRMGSVNPAVKTRYLEAGFEIVGDHPRAREARQVLDYYRDLVTEIQLEVVPDGPDIVGYEKPFGVRVNIRHTREIERESGGFAKYLTNQNNQMYAYNYGRPLEDYLDKFREGATEALEEHFEILSVTFNAEDVVSKATDDYGWRITPYAYLLLKARGPEVDKIPSLRLDLDFLDTSGYAVIPVTSPAVPLDATEEGTPRPFANLAVTQILDERKSDEGVLVLEIKASATGLVPAFDEVLELEPSEFDITEIDDQGVAVTQFADDQVDIVSERTWMVSMRAKEGLPQHPEAFEFAATVDPEAESILQRYADADLVAAEPVISLDERYGEPRLLWPWFAGGGALLLGLLWFAFSRAGRRPVTPDATRQLPASITPFSVLGLLRDIQQENGFDPQVRAELADAIARIEQHYFGPAEGGEPDLQRIAEDWLGRAG